VIAVARCQLGAADPVGHLPLGHDVHREGQPGHPRVSGQQILHVVAGGGGVGECCLGPHVVDDAGQQVRFDASRQVHVAQLPAAVAGQGRGPRQAGRARSQQVDGRHGGEAVGAGKAGQECGSGVAAARLAEPHRDPPGPDVDQVCGTRAVDVGEQDAPGVERVGGVEPGGGVHDDLGAEAAIAPVGPVAHLAVADAHQVGEAVAAHVGEVDRRVTLGKHQRRPGVLVAGRCDPLARPEAVPGQPRIPGEGTVLGQQHVGQAVTVEIDGADVRIGPVQRRGVRERPERQPAAIVVAGEIAGHRRGVVDGAQMAVAVEVRELGRAGRPGPGRLGGDHIQGLEAGLERRAARRVGADVPLVVPGGVVLGEHALEALAVEVAPAPGFPVGAGGQVGEGVRAGDRHGVVQRERRVAQYEGRQSLAVVGPAAVPDVPPLG